MSRLAIDEANRLVSLDKIIYEDIIWVHSHRQVYEFSIDIDIGENYDIRLIGSINFLVNKHSYTFLIDGERVRAIDIGQDHHNKTCQYTGKNHFHNEWDEVERDAYAIPLEHKGMGHLEKCLRWFMKQCHIVHKGSIIWPTDCQMEVLVYD